MCVAIFIHLTPYAQPKLMGCVQRRYEYMTKESPVPTLKAELEISSASLISSAGLGAGAFLHGISLSPCVQMIAGQTRISLVPSFMLLQPPSARVFYPAKSSYQIQYSPPRYDVHLGHFALHLGAICELPRALNFTPSTRGEGRKAAVCILNPPNIF